MPMLPNPALITADGAYEIHNLLPGAEYLITLKGDFDEATVQLQTWNDALGFFTDVEGGIFNGDGDVPTEARYISPGSKSQLVVSNTGFSTIGVTHTAIR